MEEFVAPVLAGAAVSALSIIPLSRLARAIGLVDRPDSRKRHTGSVPLVGGSALLLGLFVFLMLTGSWGPAALAVATFGPTAWLIGLVDDKHDLPAKLRLVMQLGVGIGLSAWAGVSITSLDGIVGASPILLTGVAATLFTAVATCGALNACNMSDGVDGLLGSTSTLTLLALAGFALHAGTYQEGFLALVLAGAMGGYLAFNLGAFGAARRVFLGDSGSMLVGLTLVVLLVSLSQGDNPAITPTSAGWLLGLPLLDTVSVMVRRVYQRRSPFAAGRDHLHHVLMDLGFGRVRTLATLASIHLMLVLVGVVANLPSMPQAVFFWLFVATTVGMFVSVGAVVRRRVSGGVITADGIAAVSCPSLARLTPAKNASCLPSSQTDNTDASLIHSLHQLNGKTRIQTFTRRVRSTSSRNTSGALEQLDS